MQKKFRKLIGRELINLPQTIEKLGGNWVQQVESKLHVYCQQVTKRFFELQLGINKRL